jgi:hypothetical protein
MTLLDRNAPRGGNIPPRCTFTGVNNRTGFDPGLWIFGISTPSGGAGKQFKWEYTLIPWETLIAWDYPSLEHGLINFTVYQEFMAPYTEPCPRLPTDPETGRVLVDRLKQGALPKDFRESIRCTVLVQNFGLAKFTSSSIIAQNVIHKRLLAYEYAREAVEGKIPVTIIRKGEWVSIASRNNEMHPQPLLEPAKSPQDWMPRTVERFGPALNPLPIPMVGRGPARQALPKAGERGALPDPFEELLKEQGAANTNTTPANENQDPADAPQAPKKGRPPI